MEKASSSQQAAQSETPTYFTQEELSKLKSDFETGGVEKIKPLLVEMVKELNNTKLNIAVTGEMGAGKSSFVNSMRGLCSEDEGGAADGTTETTIEPTRYPHPNLPNVLYWDLPGIGSTRFTAGSYLKKMQFKKYDFFIIVSAGRFRDNDVKLAKEIKRLGKRFYFVRSKIDNDLNSMRRRRKEFDEDAEMEKIRSDCVSGLGKAGIPPDPNVFLISSFDNDMYDFPRLKKALADDLPSIKESAFILALPNLSVEIIRKKGEVLKKLIWMLAIITGVGAIPVPCLTDSCDMGILIETIIHFRKCLCLNDAALRRLADRTGTSVEELKAAAQSPLLGEITVNVIVRLDLSAAAITASAIKDALYFVPVIGSIFRAGSTFLMTYMILSDALKLLMGSAEKVLAVANGTE